ncbi:hypothetical protein RHGRI_002547 [Rhododendron griersonianum]|uniref:Uncharacterized protein n=1 Tax=Rhododendron griersonianum TaxID=479676 RepID=A0AAV6LRZ2_9ERIC|nr:hypothetical protein RHGRI_002547 [Rhododendron griersonianum]
MYCHVSYLQKKLFNAPLTDLDSLQRERERDGGRTSAMVVLTVELCRDLLRPKHHFILRFCIEVGFPAYLVAGVSPATVASTPFAKWREIPMVWKTTEGRSLQLSLDDYDGGNEASANTGHDPKFGVGGGGSNSGHRSRGNP